MAKLLFAAAGFAAVITAKYVSFTRFLGNLGGEKYDWADFISVIETDIAIFLALLLLLAIPRRKYGMGMIAAILLNVIAFIYFIHSLLDLGLMLEFGSHVTKVMIEEFARRPSELVSAIGVYGSKWLLFIAGFIIISCVAGIIWNKLDKEFPSAVSRKNISVILAVLVIFFGIVAVLGSRPANKLKSNPVLLSLRGSGILSLALEISPLGNNRLSIGPADLKASYYAWQRRDELYISEPRRKPNIVIIVLETVGYKYTPLSGANGADGEDGANGANDVAKMPFLEQLSRDSIVSGSVRTTLPHTTKSLVSIFSGNYPVIDPYLSETELGFPITGLPEYLEEYGYTSAFFQSALGNYERRPSLMRNLGFDTFTTVAEELPDAQVIGMFNTDDMLLLPLMSKWMKEQDEPYMIGVLTSLTHHPYSLPDSPDHTYETFRMMGDAEKKERYIKAIEYTDSFLKEAYALSQNTDNPYGTIFIVVGDHGEGFGDHGVYSHSQNMFDESLEVPLVIAWKGGRTGPPAKITEENASLIDLMPTVISLVGSKPPRELPGIDLLSSRDESQEPRQTYFASWDPKRGIGLAMEDGIKYIFNIWSGDMQKFNTKIDPDEYDDISGSMTKEESSRTIDALLAWKTGTFAAGFDVEKSSEKMYGWICEPSGYGKCYLAY